MRHLDEGILQAWLDRPRSGLDPSEGERIERHLAGCDVCAGRLRELEATSEAAEALLSGAGPASGSPPPYEAVLARADRRDAAGRRLSAWRATAWAASVAAAVGMGWIANDLHRGGGAGDLVRSVPGLAEAERVSDTSPAGVAAAAPQRDTAPPLLAAAGSDTGASSPALGPPAADVLEEVVADGAVDVVIDGVDDIAAADVVADAAGAAAGAGSDAAGTEVAAAPTALAAPDPAIVRGRVTDEEGIPLQSAQIVAEGTGRGALTDRDGTFELRLEDVAADSGSREVTLTAQLIGYGQATRSLSVRSGESVSTDFLLADRAVALDGIVVTGAAEERLFERAGRAEAAPAPAMADQAPTPWRAVSRAEAEAEAGFRLLTVPDLPVVRIEVGLAGGATAVRVVQELDDGDSLELIEVRSELASGMPLAATAPGGGSRVVVERDGVLVVVTAPLAENALQALVERLR